MSAIVMAPTVMVGTSTFQKCSEQVERPGDPPAALGVVAREVVQLAEHDVDTDRGDEAGHDRVRDETQERAETQESSDDHHDAREDRQREECSTRVVA